MIGILSDHYGQVKSSHELALSFTQEFSLAVLASHYTFMFDILRTTFVSKLSKVFMFLVV